MPSFIRRLRDRFVRGRTQRRRSLYDKPSRERHPVSFASSILTVLTIVTGLSLPEWASSNSSKCHCVFGLTQVTCVNPQSTEGNCETLASREESNRESESKTYNTDYLTNIQTCVLPLSLPSDSILQDFTRNTDIMYAKYQCLNYYLVADCRYHQLWVSTRETRIYSTLINIQHCLK